MRAWSSRPYAWSRRGGRGRSLSPGREPDTLQPFYVPPFYCASAEGIEGVLVAGEEVVRQGRFAEARPGRVLRSGRDTATVPAQGSPASTSPGMPPTPYSGRRWSLSARSSSCPQATIPTGTQSFRAASAPCASAPISTPPAASSAWVETDPTAAPSRLFLDVRSR